MSVRLSPTGASIVSWLRCKRAGFVRGAHASGEALRLSGQSRYQTQRRYYMDAMAVVDALIQQCEMEFGTREEIEDGNESNGGAVA